jgi:glucuronosyltransferase
VIFPFPGPSHFLMLKVYINELIRRGHEVTAITAYHNDEPISNYTEILIEPRWISGKRCKYMNLTISLHLINITFSVLQNDIYQMKFNNPFKMLFTFWGMGLSSTEHALKSQNVKNFIENDNTKFDVIFAEQFFQEAMLIFAHKYQAPVVTLSKLNT